MVLYRSGWGNTPWTRIEETAIRNRGFEHGYDFVVFIPLDEQPSPPKWLPKTRLWVSLKRWGTSGGASVIEARVHEQGGEPHQETVQERAARLQRSLKFAERRKRFLNSEEGVRAALQEFKSLDKELQRLVTEIMNSVRLEIKRAEELIVIVGFGLGLSIMWNYRYINTLDNAELILRLWDRHPPFPGIMHLEDPKKLSELKFHFDLTMSGEYVCHQPEYSRQYDNKELASFMLKYFMDEGQKRRTHK